MKKLIMSLVLVGAGACHSSPPPGSTTGPSPVASGAQTGAADAVSAVRAFLAAAKEPDLQAMSVLFGDDRGPAREGLPRDELEKRELIMVRCLRHDTYDIAADAPAPGGARALVVKLSYKDVSRSSNFEVVMGPSNRWYVQKFDLVALNDICAVRG
ncbi:MAG: hypothetical protein ACREPM_08195 [Gemmatimonadaceae bacterium]